MEQRLTFITLGVNDLSTMKDFYQNKLGWKPLKETGDIVFFKVNGIIFSLYPAAELAADAGVSFYGNNGFKGFTASINFNSEEEVNSAFKELDDKTVRIIKRPQKAFWGGYSGYIEDPEQNLIELAFNPFLQLDAMGNVTGHS